MTANRGGREMAVRDETQQPVVTYLLDQGVALIKFNRPHRRNAWTPELENDYFDLLERAAADPEVRVIVVAGEGGSFCPGADFDVLQSDDPANSRLGHRGDDFPTMVPKPIVSAIEGACAGIGLTMSLATDIRFVAKDAKLTTAFSHIGLVAEHGSSWFLPRIVGFARAMELLLSSRVFSGEEAAAMGLAHRAVENGETLQVALDYARNLAARASPTAMAAIKEQLYRDVMIDLDQAIGNSLPMIARSLRHEDFRNAVVAIQRRQSVEHGPLGETRFV